MGHGITWDQVKETQVSELSVGDRWVNPGMGTAWHCRPDGTVDGYRMGWNQMPLDGVAWTLTARDGDTITATNHLGDTSTKTIKKYVPGTCTWCASADVVNGNCRTCGTEEATAYTPTERTVLKVMS